MLNSGICLLAKIFDENFTPNLWTIREIDAVAFSIALPTIVHTATARIETRMILMKWNSEYSSGITECIFHTISMMNIQIDI